MLKDAAPATADHAACYEVVRARDRRFDGRLYVAVKTTGIYCRPVCTVATPRAKNCLFFGSAAAAEGEPLATPWPELTHVFPSAARLASVDSEVIAAIGLPKRRAATIRDVARACVAGTLALEPGSDPDRLRAALGAIDGIGDWTVEYVAMRALSWPDAFPAGDLVLRRALGGLSAREVEQRSERWRPWRAYAALRLWSSSAAAQSAISGSNKVTPAARNTRSAAPSRRIQS